MMRPNSPAAAGLLALCLWAGSPAAAQDAPAAGNVLDRPAQPAQGNVSVGSPQLRDFELPGTRTTPPAAEQPVRTPASPPPASEPTEPAPRTAQPVRRAPAPAAATERPAIETPAPALEAPAAEDSAARLNAPRLGETLPEAIPVEPTAADTLAPAAPTAPAVAEPALSSWSPWWIALAAALAALGGLFFFRRGRRPALAAEAPAAALPRASLPEPTWAPEPAPEPVRPPAPPAGTVTLDMRPWIEVEFKPDRVVATDSEATVHFDLAVKNVGRSPARNVRIQAKMFNPSARQKQEIDAFFAAPAEAGGAPMVIPPQLGTQFKTSVAMPKASVREVQVQGRSLFIPTVAISIFYEWGDGQKGQTCQSYVVGTEAQASEKMGPFRLDLGPRVYRQVGGRALELARAV